MDRILRKWDIFRRIRLILGMLLIAYGMYSGEVAVFLPGFLLVWMAILNLSGCFFGGCTTSQSQKPLYKDFVKVYDVRNNKR